ncbi:tetratricopeptide repeat-containing sulfotransferase family protein [Kaarinaea lacus]
MSTATPSKVSALIHKAFSLHQQGKVDKAEKHYHKALKQEPNNFDALQGLGAIALHKKRYPQAINYLQSAHAIMPDEPGLLTNLGLAYKHNKNSAKAKEYFEKSTRIDNTFGPAFYNLALLHFEKNETEKALQLFYEAERCRPGHIPTLTSIASTLLRLGSIHEAIQYLRHAIQLDPDNADLHFELGKCFQSIRQDQNAIDELNRTLSINPQFLEARAKLADVFESSNKIDNALAEADTILTDDPRQPLATLVRAKIDRRQGNLEQARERLTSITDNNDKNNNNDIWAGIYTELGNIHDRLGDYQAAFGAFSNANRIMANLPSTKAIDPDEAYHIINAYSSWLDSHKQSFRKPGLETGNANTGSNDGLNDLPSPVFLVGFPRSGTTLTEQILATHEEIITGDEWPVLHHMATHISEILGRDVNYPDCIDEFSNEDIHQLQGYYWNQVASLPGKTPSLSMEKISHHLFIDKMPLNIIHLGLIARIFPHSKIIIALRDPRDVCLSCFMQLFLVNESMLQFLDITTTGKYYSAVMNLWLQYRELLEHRSIQLDWIESRYEDIVSDLHQSSTKLFSFLGIDPEKVSGDFHQQAANRSISTPSYQDVSTPVYRRAMGRWQHYREHLNPVMKELAPFIDAFGYQQVSNQ